MNQDISASREKAHRAIGLRLKQAIRESQTANDQFDETLANFLGVNRTDGRCLDIIDRKGPITAGQLATESGLTTGAVTAIIDRLERQSYVRRRRDEADRRKIYIENTDQIRQISVHLFAHFARLGPALTSRFSPEQIRGIIQFLETGSHVNREMATILARHAEPAADDNPNWRLEQAKAFESAAEAETPRLTRDLETIARKVDDSF